MRSELRNAYVRSGALPSDIRMGYAAVGPLSPSGPLAYIPPAPNYRAPAGSTVQGNYVNTMSVTANSMTANNLNSIRYSGTTAVPQASYPTMATNPAPAPANALNPGPLNASVSAPVNPFVASFTGNSTIRYSSP
jgi:hypothetical protein